jgi:saposin
VFTFTECVVCVQVFNYVDSFLTENKTEEKIIETLERVCGFLPESISGQCDSIVDQYTPVLIQLIAAEFTPQEICQALGLCDAAKRMIPKVPKYRKPIIPMHHFKRHAPSKKIVGKTQVKDIQCEVCIQAMGVVESYLKKNSTEQEIENAIKQACSYLPSETAAQCNALVEEFLPILINLIVSEFTPNQICQAIYMCPQQQKQAKGYSTRMVWPVVRPHFSSTCNQGPRYWCQSVETAKTCGLHALLVCNRKYWSKHH